MTLLALVTYTVIGHYDVAFTTHEPVECDNVTIEATIEEFKTLYGLDVWASCDYTAAPATSIRPEARP
jgi:hypothetical protein